MSNTHKSQAKKPVRTKANLPKAHKTEPLAEGSEREAQLSQAKSQVNPCEPSSIESVDYNLLLLGVFSPELRRCIGSVWSRHLEGRYHRMECAPFTYFRITLGVKAGLGRSVLADMVGSGYNIPINAFIKLGYAGTRRYLSRDYEDLKLTAKGERLYADFMQEIEKAINSVPKPKTSDNQK